MKRKQLTGVALAGLIVPALLAAPTALATEEVQTAVSEMGKPGKKVSNTQSSNTSPAKENTATSNQQSKKRNTTKNSKNTTEKLTTESSTVKPVGKTSTETTTDSQI